MAFCFEPVVNFGENAEAAREAALTSPIIGAPIPVGRHRIPLHRFIPNTADYSYVQLSVLPVAVGFQVAIDGLAAGSISGLALSRALHNELGLRGNGNYAEFKPGYLWSSYLGEKPSWHTRYVDDQSPAG
jgi:hypothetical protein